MKKPTNIKISLVLGLLLVIGNCFAQVSIVDNWGKLSRTKVLVNGEVVTRIRPARNLSLYERYNSRDTIKIYLVADSLSNKIYNFDLEVVYPKSYNKYSVGISIETLDGSYFVVGVNSEITKEGRLKYYLSKEAVYALYAMRLKGITFSLRDNLTNDLVTDTVPIDGLGNIFFFTFLHEIWDKYL